MITDLNANHPTLGYRHTNTKGRQIQHLINQRILTHKGPSFSTFHAHNTTTTPDIILTNYRTYHNTLITQGPLTNSDHIPILLTISTAPIQTQFPPRPNFRTANWEEFQNEINNRMNSNDNVESASLEEIDREINTWYEIINRATQKRIPTTQYRTLPNTPHTMHTQNLIAQFNALKRESHIHGWTIQHYNR